MVTPQKLISSHNYAVLRSQRAITSYLKSEQLLHFDFLEQYTAGGRRHRLPGGLPYYSIRDVIGMHPDYQDIYIPVNSKHLYNIYTMLGQRRRRWANVV